MEPALVWVCCRAAAHIAKTRIIRINKPCLMPITFRICANVLMRYVLLIRQCCSALKAELRFDPVWFRAIINTYFHNISPFHSWILHLVYHIHITITTTNYTKPLQTRVVEISTTLACVTCDKELWPWIKRYCLGQRYKALIPVKRTYFRSSSAFIAAN